jgi:Fe-S oxidoreductase
MAARIYYFITRAPHKDYITEAYQRQMAKADDCTHCGNCKENCPYGLDTPELVRRQYELYKGFVAEHMDEVTPGV